MAPMPLAPQLLGLAGWLVLTFGMAAIGGIASAKARGFYRDLVRPGWAPPGWLFAPVWSTLYLLMGIAAWLVWREGGFAPAATALTLFIVQLLVNALWTWIFFVWRKGALAFLEVLLLWALILATTLAFRQVRPVAAVLLLPYLAWVTFASALTFAEWRRNPGLLG